MSLTINPRQYLKAWIKPSPLADVTHCIIRFDNEILVAYCGCQIRLKDASQVVKGARHCVDCEGLRRQHLEARRRNEK
jgi:hypothetical protein